MRTNCSLEGINNSFNQRMDGHTQNFFKWIDALKKFDETMYMRLREFENGHLPYKSKAVLGIERRKKALVQGWEFIDPADKNQVIQYLRAVASSLGNKSALN